ncbi:hypothetical protein HNR42_001344 [Deinobacterium chartae]|uniref:Uncharacterized protein n=1 Tax=Deinobacterium chartae TaxID=521158 RepID=A0A841HWL1_9DEIO|nr:hypothetical protein [Deinobacterium chartae]MBB6097921.1 hypothetical protein [Deinobacterium chartae]
MRAEFVLFVALLGSAWAQGAPALPTPGTSPALPPKAQDVQSTMFGSALPPGARRSSSPRVWEAVVKRAAQELNLPCGNARETYFWPGRSDLSVMVNAFTERLYSKGFAWTERGQRVVPQGLELRGSVTDGKQTVLTVWRSYGDNAVMSACAVASAP